MGRWIFVTRDLAERNWSVDAAPRVTALALWLPVGSDRIPEQILLRVVERIADARRAPSIGQSSIA
jgi:hypothetical protein